MKDAPREHDRGQGHVSAPVHHNVDVLRDERSVFLDAGAMFDAGRMALRRRPHVLVPVVDHLDGTFRFEREKRRVARDHVRVLFFAPEPAAGRRLNDTDFVGFPSKQRQHRLVHVVRALDRAHQDECAVVFLPRRHPVGLDVGLLLMRHPVLLFDDDIRVFESLLDVTLRDLEALENVVVTIEKPLALERFLHREDGIPRLIFHLDVREGFVRLRPVLVPEDENGLFRVVHFPFDEKRLIHFNEVDVVLARNVFGGDDNDVVPVVVGIESNVL